MIFFWVIVFVCRFVIELFLSLMVFEVGFKVLEIRFKVVDFFDLFGLIRFIICCFCMLKLMLFMVINLLKCLVVL